MVEKAKKTNQRGIAALLVVIVVGAAALIMAYTASVVGLGELELSYTSQKGKEALAAANACVEEALRQISLDNNYQVDGYLLAVGDGSCIMSVSVNGNNRLITVLGTVDQYNKKIEAQVTLSGSDIIIDSWQEVSN